MYMYLCCIMFIIMITITITTIIIITDIMYSVARGATELSAALPGLLFLYLLMFTLIYFANIHVCHTELSVALRVLLLVLLLVVVVVLLVVIRVAQDP